MSDILYAGAHWIGPANPDNYMVGRSTYSVHDIVVHHTASSLQGAINRFKTSSGQSQPNPSAHFIIDRDGTRYQMVDTADMAYHSADYFENLVSIGIEHVRLWGSGPGTAGYEPITDAQYQSSHELCTILAADNGFPLTSDHVWPHNHFYNTTCPGDFDIPQMIKGDTVDPDTLAKLQAFLNGAAGGAGQGGGYDFAGLRVWWATAASGTDPSKILAAIADLRAHPSAADPTLAAKIDALAKHLGVGTP